MNRLKNLKTLKVLCTVVANLMIFFQIILVILVLLLSSYVFMQLLNIHILDFIQPVAGFSKGIIHFFFADTIKAGRPEIDGELVLAIIIDIVLAFVAAQMRSMCQNYEKNIDKKIVEESEKEELRFNKELEHDLYVQNISYTNYTICCVIKVASLISDAMRVYGQEAIDTAAIREEVLTKLQEALKNLPNVEISRKGNVLMLSSGKFEKVDMVLETLQTAIAKFKKEYKTQKVAIKSRLAIDTYKKTDSVESVLPDLLALLKLNLGNDILCYGNFYNRYALLKDTKYEIFVKGKYDIGEHEQTIWGLVKKD